MSATLPCLWVLSMALVALLAYCRGDEHGMRRTERRLRLDASPTPPTPPRRGVRAPDVTPLTPLEVQRILAPESWRDTLGA